MRATRLASFTLKTETIERLNKLSKEKSINKSSFVDRVINQEIDIEEKSQLLFLKDLKENS